MVEKIYFFDNRTENLDERLEELAAVIPCFIDREFIEMDWSKVTIQAREEDLATVERFLADLI